MYSEPLLVCAEPLRSNLLVPLITYSFSSIISCVVKLSTLFIFRGLSTQKAVRICGKCRTGSLSQSVTGMASTASLTEALRIDRWTLYVGWHPIQLCSLVPQLYNPTKSRTKWIFSSWYHHCDAATDSHKHFQFRSWIFTVFLHRLWCSKKLCWETLCTSSPTLCAT